MRDKNIDIILIPNNEGRFIRDLIKNKKALREYEFKNGEKHSSIWSASKINEDSDLLLNIKTNNFYRENRSKLNRVIISIIYDANGTSNNTKDELKNKISDYIKNCDQNELSDKNDSCAKVGLGDWIFNTDQKTFKMLTIEQVNSNLSYKSFIEIYNECEKISGLSDLKIRENGEIPYQAHSDIMAGRISLSKERAIQYAFGFKNKQACMRFINETIGGLGNSKRDMIIKFFIENEEFDINELDYFLEKFHCEKIFRRKGKDN